MLLSDQILFFCNRLNPHPTVPFSNNLTSIQRIIYNSGISGLWRMPLWRIAHWRGIILLRLLFADKILRNPATNWIRILYSSHSLTWGRMLFWLYADFLPSIHLAYRPRLNSSSKIKRTFIFITDHPMKLPTPSYSDVFRLHKRLCLNISGKIF